MKSLNKDINSTIKHRSDYIPIKISHLIDVFKKYFNYKMR